MWRNLALIGLFELALFGVFLTSFSLATDQPADFVWVNESEPQTLDPAKMTGQPEGRIAETIFEGLTVFHPKTLKPLPGIAERWEISPDGRLYTFHLRHNAYWVRGATRLRPTTAQDFVYSWKRLLDPATASEYDYILYYIKGAEEYKKRRMKSYADFIKSWQDRDPTITSLTKVPAADRKAYIDAQDRDFAATVGVRAKDEFTLEVELKAMTPYFTGITSFYPTYPVNAECVEADPELWTRAKFIVTNGPFFLESWRFNEKIRVRRNAHYWDAAQVGMETMEALPVEEITTALNLFLKGKVHWVPQIPPQLITEIKKRDEEKGSQSYHNFRSFTGYFYRVNVTREPFQGERGKWLRQALSLAIDRESIVKNVTKAGQQPAYSIVPPLDGYDGAPGLRTATREEAVKRAQDLLTKAGFPGGKGFPKKVLLYNSNELHKTIAVAVQNMWQQNLGIDIVLQNQEWGTYLDSVQQRNFDLARAAWIGDYSDPNTFLDMWITDGPQNNTGWSSPHYDRLIGYGIDIGGTLTNAERCAAFLKDLPALAADVDAYRTEKNPDQLLARGVAIRQKVLRACDDFIADELPIIPVYFYTMNELWAPDLLGLEENSRDTHMPQFFRWAPGSPRAKRTGR